MPCAGIKLGGVLKLQAQGEFSSVPFFLCSWFLALESYPKEIF
jgi:hypothetical protein